MSERLNAYYCKECRRYIVTIDRDHGVTPMFLACRVLGDPSDPGNTCKGQMQSMGYPSLPWLENAPEPTPTWEWYRPTDLAGFSEGMRDHIQRGGLALRQVSA